MRTPLTIQPQVWLAAVPSPVAAPGSVLATFLPAPPPRVFRFDGPHRFFRAAGWDSTKGRLASPYGAFWIDEAALSALVQKLEMYRGWLPNDELRRAHSARYRAMAAICEDWNDLGEVFEMSLPPGQALEGLAGITKEQPQRSTMDASQRTTPMLAGGAEQIFIKVKNPLWVRQTSL
jgi:hypothetical protein